MLKKQNIQIDDKLIRKVKIEMAKLELKGYEFYDMIIKYYFKKKGEK